MRNIFLIGPMGAGKTTIGRQLARALQMDFFDSDQQIEDSTGVDISWIFDVEGEAGFQAREVKVIDDLTQHRNIVLATGGGTILNADNRKNLAARGVVVYLKASIEQQLQRVVYDKKRPTLQKGDKRAVIEELNAEREPLYAEISDVSFFTDARSAQSVVKDILTYLQGGET